MQFIKTCFGTIWRALAGKVNHNNNQCIDLLPYLFCLGELEHILGCCHFNSRDDYDYDYDYDFPFGVCIKLYPSYLLGKEQNNIEGITV